MEKLLLFFLLFVSLAAAKAQDKINTIKQATNENRILSFNSEGISHQQKTSDRHVIEKSISTSNVLHTGKHESSGTIIYQEKTNWELPDHCWIFSLQSGLAHSLTDYSYLRNLMLNAGSSESWADNYIGKLENGYHINTSLYYLLKTFWGLGADYNLFYSASKGEFLVQGWGGISLPVFSNVELNERIYTHFAGVSVLFQQFPGKKNRIRISETITPGIVFFRDESRGREFQYFLDDNNSNTGESLQYYDHANSLTRSSTLGAKGGLSIEYVINPQLSAGLTGNFMLAKIYKVSVKNSEYDTSGQRLEKPMNISHSDYGFTIRYIF